MRAFLLVFMVIGSYVQDIAFCDSIDADQDSKSYRLVRRQKKKRRRSQIQENPVISEDNAPKEEGVNGMNQSESQVDSSINTVEVKDDMGLLDIEQEIFFVVITIPKSGTHLLKVALEEITDKKSLGPAIPSLSISAINKHYKDLSAFVVTHTVEDFFNYLQCRLPRNGKIILMVRDYRDMVLSFVNYIESSNKASLLCNLLSMEEWRQLSKKEKIELFIQEDRFHFNAFKNGSEVAKKIVKTFPNVYVCRFENLIGSKGGGSDYLLYQELSNLAKFVNAPVDEVKLQQLVHSLHGSKRSYTFFKGEIGSWKAEFDEDIKDLFKQKLGKTLIDWGYEQDNNW